MEFLRSFAVVLMLVVLVQASSAGEQLGAEEVTSLVAELRKENQELKEKNALLEEDLKEKCKASTKPDDGWIDGRNGFQYTLTSLKNWLAVKIDCEVMGGALAATGIRNKNDRKYIGKQLKIKKAWIGLSDRDEEGVYKWIDDVKGKNKNINWAKDQPDGGSSQNCGMIIGKQFKVQDAECFYGMHGLCEKPLQEK